MQRLATKEHSLIPKLLIGMFMPFWEIRSPRQELSQVPYEAIPDDAMQSLSDTEGRLGDV